LRRRQPAANPCRSMLVAASCCRSFSNSLFTACALMLEQNWSTGFGSTKYCQRSAPVIVTRSAQFSAVGRSSARFAAAGLRGLTCRPRRVAPVGKGSGMGRRAVEACCGVVGADRSGRWL
jgi:hypothetical protein